MHRRVPYAEAATGGRAFHKRLDSLKQAVPRQTRDQRILSLLQLAHVPTPDDPRSRLEMDLHVPLTADQFFQNVDSTMIAVKRHEPAPIESVPLTAAERERFTGTYRMSPIHRVEVTDGEEGLHLRMDRGEKAPFVDTDLHPLSSERLATDVTDVYVERRPGEAGLTLAWKDTTYAMAPVDDRFILPLEHIRAGRLEEGAAGFREAEAQGIKLASSLMVRPLTDLIEEQTMPTWPDSMSETERARRALPYTRLATELAPKSWLAHFELAYVHKRLGHTEAMRRAAQRAVRLAPLDGADLVREWLDLTVTADGRVE
jgi:tetratricopeptide (TPR) repeat protein